MSEARINEEPYHVDFSNEVGVLVRIESVDSIEYSDQSDGEFEVVVRIRGCVNMRPDGLSVADAVGGVLYALLGEDVDEEGDGALEFTLALTDES